MLKRKDIIHDAVTKGYELYPDVPYFVVKKAVSLQQQHNSKGSPTYCEKRNSTYTL